MSLQRPPPVYSKSTRRHWRSFSLNDFRADLQSSALCDAQCWRGLDGDSLSQLYDDTITQLLDRQVPAETKTCRRRPSNAWFDDECRHAKRQLRSTERAARRAGPIQTSTHRQCRPGDSNVGNTSTYCVRRQPISGQIVSLLIISCWNHWIS